MKQKNTHQKMIYNKEKTNNLSTLENILTDRILSFVHSKV